jgi:hypothetical protein
VKPGITFCGGKTLLSITSPPGRRILEKFVGDFTGFSGAKFIIFELKEGFIFYFYIF